MKNKKLVFGMFFLIGILLINFAAASSYSRSNPNYGAFNSYVQDTEISDRERCEAGQDFIIQIAPFGCTPAVVRSDLLEEQNVPVFCQLAATKINPLIDVEAIESISFSGDYPKEVSGISFHPARAALGVRDDLNSPLLDNIGYVVVVLRKEEIEADMPEYVSGNLTAKIRYDIKNAFGIGRASFYLPELTDNDFEDKKTTYSFWNGKGYLRAESVDENSAVISIYNDLRKVSTATLDKGETSNKISMPNMDCLANLQLRLDGLEAPDTRARFEINGEVVEVTKDEYFLDNACRVTGLEKKGIVEDVDLRCKTDDGTDSFSLRVSPHVNLTICDKNGENCKTGDYGSGDSLNYSVEDRNVFLGYIGEDKGKSYILPVISTANTKEAFLKSIDQDFIETYVDILEKDTSVIGLAKLGLAFGGESVNAIVRGTDFGYRIFEGKGSKDVEFVFDNLGSKVLESGGTCTVAGVVGSFFVGGPFGVAAVGAICLAVTSGFLSGVDMVFQEERKMSFNGFSSGRDIELSGDAKQNYETAMKDYDRVLNSYSKEPCEGYENCGEEALYKKIILAFNSQQRLAASRLCDEFKSSYSKSNLSLGSYCDDKFKLANQEISTHEVVINNAVKRISFEGIIEPSWEEFSAEVTVKTKKETYSYVLLKDKKVNLNEEFFYLRNLDLEYATFDVSNINYGGVSEAFSGGPSSLKIKLDECKLVGKNGYEICVNKINLKNVAKVSVIPNVDNAGTEANFSFKVGIEKRGIQLSPDEIENKINNLNESIGEWQDKSEKLGKVVKGLKTACLATGAYYTIKNFWINTGGKGIARNEIMNGAGGWNEKCSAMVGSGKKYSTIEACLFDEENSKAIDKEVDTYYNALTKQNEEIKIIENGCPKTEFLTEVNVDTNCFKSKFAPNVKSELEKNLDGDKEITIGTEKVKISKILEGVNANSTSVEELRRLQLNSRIDSSMANAQVEKDLAEIYVNTKSEVELKDVASQIGQDAGKVAFVYRDEAKEVQYAGETYGGIKNKVSIITGAVGTDAYSTPVTPNDNTPVQTILTSDGKKYIAVLDKNGDNYAINTLYDFNGNLVEDKDLMKSVYFKKYDSSSYENKFESVSGEKGVVVKFYETDPYKGLPALVPFDLENGWYAATKQTLPVAGGIQAYDESGRVTSLWVCNVGENGIAEFKSGIGDDECRQVNLGTGATYSAFPYLDPGKAIEIVRCAVDAIEDASKYKSGPTVGISTTCDGSHSINIGSPAVDIPEMQCTDYMSPSECKLLFNVCDPVICPSSRCDLGGAYPVKDVVQSGIIGSIALCLPNYREGIYVPVCLTGIKAGIDGYLSVLKAHRDCLQESLDSGKTVGICDEIYSINLCEFFWRQGLPLAKLVLPKLIEYALGQNVHGGGEYMGVANAWSNAEKSVNYFTQYYAVNSFEAFKARTAEEVGGEICKNFASGVYPEGGNLLDSLTEPDSPAQYHGRFDEIPFTTATVPAISQYKVFYHIYAGEDQGAYYQVYLTEGDESSFYQDTSYRRIVDSGYIKKGGYADETKDFTAPSGYKKLCIRVNDEEECGFKQVSTSYAINYVEDKYLEEQASQTDIKTESECISGTASAYSLISPNLQEGVNEVADPAIYNRGIIRICSTDNPGRGTDESRWSEVGYCDNEKIKCWIDRKSVSNVIEDANIENNTLSTLANNSLSILINDGECLQKDFVEGKIKEKEELIAQGKYLEAIALVNSIIDKVCWNDQKIKLLFNRGDAYSNLVEVPKIEVIEKTTTTTETPTTTETTTETKDLVCESFTCVEGKSISTNLNIMGGDSCWKSVGGKVISIANKVRDEKVASKSYLSDNVVAKEIGVSSFGCLVAMIARQEGCLAHCKYKEGETNPLYCNGQDEDVIIGDKGDSIGMMQINKNIHGEHYTFQDNVEYAANYLISRYSTTSKSYGCAGATYSGWKKALRYYNGWNTDCSVGDKNYVENVLSRKDEIIRLVPECAVNSETLCRDYCEENSGGETFYSYSGLTSSQCDAKEADQDPYSYSSNLNCCCYYEKKAITESSS